MSNFTHYNSDPLIAAASAILEGKQIETTSELDESTAYSVVKEIENQLKDVKGHFKNFHDGHEEDALEEIMGTLSYCTTLAKKAQKLL
jgi:hypothetical protein